MSTVVDMAAWLKSVHRTLPASEEQRAVVLRRHYRTSPADLWDALTTPERVARWMGRIEGVAAAGETIVVHDAGMPLSWTAEIRACEVPHRFVMTWRFNGEDTMGMEHDDTHDEVEVRLTPDGDGTVLELEHRSPDPGDWNRGAGIGWENFLLNLAGYVEDLDVAPLFESGEIWPHLQGAWEQA